MICSQGGLIPSLSDANLTPSGPPRISPCGPDRLAIRVAADTVPSKSARKGARPQMPAAGRPGLIAEETSEHRRQRRCADDGTGQGRARRDSVYQGAHGKTHQALPRRGCGASSRKLIPSRAGYLAGSTQARRKRPPPEGAGAVPSDTLLASLRRRGHGFATLPAHRAGAARLPAIDAELLRARRLRTDRTRQVHDRLVAYQPASIPCRSLFSVAVLVDKAHKNQVAGANGLQSVPGANASGVEWLAHPTTRVWRRR